MGENQSEENANQLSMNISCISRLNLIRHYVNGDQGLKFNRMEAASNNISLLDFPKYIYISRF